MIEKIPCAYCDSTAQLKKEKKEVPFRKDNFTLLVHFYQCVGCKEKFTNHEADNLSLLQLHNLYREKYQIPYPDELMEMRSRYGLSAAKMSEILGLGANGYSNYENGEMPTPAIGNLLSAASDAATFIQFIHKKSIHFSDNGFAKLKDRLQQLIENSIADSVDSPLTEMHSKPDQYNGFKKINLGKLTSLIKHFIKHSKPEFNDKLKINKLLFFTDFLHFKHHGYAISGLR
ncbi:MAG: DNA-binding protein, partial [Sediminibacterium sp.]|nr:DNA-binding protein [Sediminibacterium sp.]